MNSKFSNKSAQKISIFSSKANYARGLIYDLGLPEFPDFGLGFINGMNTAFENLVSGMRALSEMGGGCNVQAVYNATHGPFLDLLECGMGLLNIATEPVQLLHKMWDNFFQKSSSRAIFLMICHSQGGIHVKNALLSYSPELRERILVLAIAPGGYIDPNTCKDVWHYRAHAWRDFVPQIDIAGAIKADGTIRVLDSHSDASFFDHDFMSPTYREIFKQHITSYIQSKGKSL